MERKSRAIDDSDFIFDINPISDAASASGMSEYSASSGRNTFTRGGFQRTAVKRNHETGEIQGWQEFYELVCMDDPSLEGEMQINRAKQERAMKKWEKAT